MKKSNDNIGNRIRDLPACSAMPQPTALPPAPDATVHSLFYLETALHVSGGTITHHQERKQLYLQHLVFVTLLLISAAVVEELELVGVCCGWRTPGGVSHPQHTPTGSNSSTMIPPEICRVVSR